MINGDGARLAHAPESRTRLLTERELEVLELLAGRYTNKEIARQLIVSHHTVRNHTASIYDKLQVSGRRAAVARAHDLGLLPASP